MICYAVLCYADTSVNMNGVAILQCESGGELQAIGDTNLLGNRTTVEGARPTVTEKHL